MQDKENVTVGVIETIENAKNVPWKISDVVFTYVLIFALSIMAIGLIILSGIDADNSIFPAILQIILSAITVSVIYFIVTKKYNYSFIEAFGFYFNKTPKYLGQGIFVAFVLVISTTLVSYTFTQLLGIERQNPYINISEEKLRIISVLAIFIAPVVEEIFFRGFMQPAIIKSIGTFGGIFITALIFGLSHSQYLDYSTALVAVTVIGLILGITRYYTGSVMPGIFAHLLNNLFAALSLHQ